jgi:hypothetical protein
MLVLSTCDASLSYGVLTDSAVRPAVILYGHLPWVKLVALGTDTHIPERECLSLFLTETLVFKPFYL